MGRKSNTKKKVRELAKDKVSKEKKKLLGKKTKKEIKLEAKEEARKKLKQKKKPSSKKTKSKPDKSQISKKTEQLKQTVVKHKKRIFGGVLAIIMFLLLISVGYLIFSRALRATPIARFLPEDRTIALLEINTNPSHNQVVKSFELLQNQPGYSREEVSQKLETKFGLNFKQEIEPWVGRVAGMAILHSHLNPGDIDEIYFAEIINKAEFENFLADKTATNEDARIFAVAENLFATKKSDYLIAAASPEALSEILDSDKSDKLYSSSRYQRIRTNLPSSNGGFAYIDFSKISDSFFNHFKFLGERGFSTEIVTPFIRFTEAGGFSIVALDDKFILENFITLDDDKLKNAKYIDAREKYRANLTDLVKDDLAAYWGGQNLEHQIRRFIELLANGDQDASLIFEKFIENQVKKYFGNSLSLQDDIYPLFQKEFALAIEQEGDKYVYKLLLELADPNEAAFKIEELANGFVNTGGFFEPKVVEHTLEDGTVSREIIASPEAISRSERDYEGVTISELKMGEREWGIYYAIIEDKALISNHFDGIKSSIDILRKNAPSLLDSNYYTINIAPVIDYSDELTFFNFGKLMPLFEEEGAAPGVFKIIDTFSSGRNYFRDGIKSTNYVHIK